MSLSNKRTSALSIPEQYNFERVVSTKHREFIREIVLRNHITANSYEDSLVIDCRLFEKKIFHIKNKHSANAIHYKILGCIDPKLGWEELKAETSLAASSTIHEWDTEPWAYVKVQVKSAVADSHGKVDVVIACQN